ncbi:MAG: YicC family protein [Gammaproteobacteria bacterium]|nr:MAG: YicC family protein [Gammaproteobacteria bacterium]
MIRSMTAFSRQDSQGDWGGISLEIRSVNHRYLDISLRLPEEFRAMEPYIREKIGQSLKRGKVDCNIRYQLPENGNTQLTVNMELARRLSEVSRDVDHLLYNSAPINSLDILRWPGIMLAAEHNWGKMREEAKVLIEAGLKDLLETRGREGEKLKQLITKRLTSISEIVVKVRKSLPEILNSFRKKLHDRLAEIKTQLDESRIEQEIAVVAQRMDVDEELDRLDSHVSEVQRVLEQKEPVGRRLDFLMQELNREANTLGSKSVSSEMTRASVDLKVLIEQMREQVQNIE